MAGLREDRDPDNFTLIKDLNFQICDSRSELICTSFLHVLFFSINFLLYSFHALSEGYSAQAARLFLPNSAATKLIMYASPDTWRHVFEQRISDKADPMIRELLEPLKEEFVKEGLL